MGRRVPEERIAERERFVALAVEGKSIAQIAKAMKMTPRSVYAWLRRPAIRRRIEQAACALTEAHVTGLLATGEKARDTLVRLLKSDSEQIRLMAARALLAETGRAITVRRHLVIPTAGDHGEMIFMTAAELMAEARRLIAEKQAAKAGYQRADEPADIDRALLEAKRRMGMIAPEPTEGKSQS